MTGHLNFLPSNPIRTLREASQNILTAFLRDEMGYQGLIVTDAMDMGGITVSYAPERAAVRAIVAGIDVL